MFLNELDLKQKETFMAISQAPLDVMIEERFPFRDQEFLMGLLICPLYSYDADGNEVLEFEGDLSILSEKCKIAVKELGKAMDGLCQ